MVIGEELVLAAPPLPPLNLDPISALIFDEEAASLLPAPVVVVVVHPARSMAVMPAIAAAGRNLDFNIFTSLCMARCAM
jgi:hypothetical protein